MHLHECTNERTFITEAVAFLSKRLKQAIDERGTVILGLSGGSTPGPVYEALGKEKIAWEKVQVFLLDERFVDAKDPQSNQLLVRSTLLRHASILSPQLYFPDTTLPLGQCRETYDTDLRNLLADRPADVAVLGFGTDGHIASLFPPLQEEWTHAPPSVVHTTTNRFAVRDRLSVTLPVIASARCHLLLLKGGKKKQVWEEMMASGASVERWPVKAITERDDAHIVTLW